MAKNKKLLLDKKKDQLASLQREIIDLENEENDANCLTEKEYEALIKEAKFFFKNHTVKAPWNRYGINIVCEITWYREDDFFTITGNSETFEIEPIDDNEIAKKMARFFKNQVIPYLDYNFFNDNLQSIISKGQEYKDLNKKLNQFLKKGYNLEKEYTNFSFEEDVLGMVTEM